MDFDPLKKLLDKKMDRKEFLMHVGAALVALSGIAAIIKSLSDPFRKLKDDKGSTKHKSNSFGNGPYGG